jgi:hypothetical protein
MSNKIPYVSTAAAVALALGLGMSSGVQAVSSCIPTNFVSAGGVHPQATQKPGNSCTTRSADGNTTFVVTPEGKYPAQDNNENLPGSNFLMTVYENYRRPDGSEMVNTLPSTPDGRYNLHDGPVTVRDINPASPETDLDVAIADIEQGYRSALARKRLKRQALKNAIDILEGNPLTGKAVVNRAYEGFAMLHYTGPLRNGHVQPIFDANGVKIGGNLDVDMIYFGENLESSASMIDPSEVLEVPWTITYHINILHNGIEDFSPSTMFLDLPTTEFPMGGVMQGGISMDQSYFPMLKEGTRYTIKIKEPPGKFYNLTYVWGWRLHPGRVQVTENSTKSIAGKTLFQYETEVFGTNPRADQATKEAAINKIGDLAPAKRMWNRLRELKAMMEAPSFDVDAATPKVEDLRLSYLDWLTRTKLPRGVTADPNSEVTLFYANNTIYGGSTKARAQGEGSGLGAESYKGTQHGFILDWKVRPYLFKVTLLNGDHFVHGYVNVDFGGSRGWENQFQFTDPTTVVYEGDEPLFPIDRGGPDEFLEQSPRNADINADPQLGSGCFFTFGRYDWWINAGGPWGLINVPPVAADGTVGRHNVEITYNFEPSLRLSAYQFDPFHHDVAIWSMH